MVHKKTTFLLVFLLTITCNLFAQTDYLKIVLEKQLNRCYDKYTYSSKKARKYDFIKEVKIDDKNKSITIETKPIFASQKFTNKSINKIYKKVSKAFNGKRKKYDINIRTCGLEIEDLALNSKSNRKLVYNSWGNIEYKGLPWVQNVSKPYEVEMGLANKHLSLWASHGRYFDNKSNTWKWQRPNLFCTNEDVFTSTIVVPFLIPMLENAGAVVFTPRERDLQPNEIIVDNDGNSNGKYSEEGYWTSTAEKGFALHPYPYNDHENPFEAGTSKACKATRNKYKYALTTYTPNIPEEGKYAVYVSYQTTKNSIPDAHYTVWHQGEKTDFVVNQQMGGGTWVYLGSFYFDKGENVFNCVTLNNQSKFKGEVTTDAVRFGGGMGNIVRGGTTSNFLRALEGSRYYAQWAGAPYSVYASKNGQNDYAEDINARSLMTNWLAGGSVFLPNKKGKNVPIELCLAVHSDAGFTKKPKQIIGSLAICTTNFNEGRYNSGISRNVSYDFAKSLIANITRDLSFYTKNWEQRSVRNQNYSETRIPEMPSAILETMSHQNFEDMKHGHDPNFKFELARSIYKTILRQVANSHGNNYIVQPLPPQNFQIKFVKNNKIELTWNATEDTLESTATPTGYVLYTAEGHRGFDNGKKIKTNKYVLKLEPDKLYNFRITAINKGGESFPTEVLSAYFHSKMAKNILIVNGFDRLSSPSVIDGDTTQGFDIDEDPGVSYGNTAGWIGKQVSFDKNKAGLETEEGLGYSNAELEGKIIAGNTFDYVKTHADAITATNKYNVISSSKSAFLNSKMDLKNISCIDYILGLEKDDYYSSKRYKTFSQAMQQKLKSYTSQGGNIIVSGSYIASDIQKGNEKEFLTKLFSLGFGKKMDANSSNTIRGLGLGFNIYTTLNPKHYAATTPNSLSPTSNGFCAMQYENGECAAIAAKNINYNSFAMGFPFECIKSKSNRINIMQGILNFLLQK